MARYLVTGGTGFVGSHLCDTLVARGHSVIAFDSMASGFVDNLDPQVRLEVGDVVDTAAVGRLLKSCRGVFHLAASPTGLGRAASHKTNSLGALVLFQAAADAGSLPVVYASSSSVYGPSPKPFALQETALIRPSCAVAADKLCAESLAAEAWLTRSVPSVGLRFSEIYGNRQDHRVGFGGLVAIAANSVARGVPLAVSDEGRNVRDYLHVGDAVRYLVASMESLSAFPRASVLNAGTGFGTTTASLVAAVAAASGLPAATRRASAVAEGPHGGVLDASLALRELGIQPLASLAAGLERTIFRVPPVAR